MRLDKYLSVINPNHLTYKLKRKTKEVGKKYGKNNDC